MPSTEIKPALVAFLKADTGVAALVGARIYPQALDQRNRTFPQVCYALIGENRPASNSGPLGKVLSRFQLVIVGTTEASVEAVGKAIKDATGGAKGVPATVGERNKLHGFRGTIDGVTVEGAFLEDVRDEYDPSVFGSNLGEFLLVQQWAIHWRE